ncbi:MAG: DNA methyltransferase [Methanoregula sp.]|uniref:DNA methyltransferase n=1 Tax=Methanoregula sp. TaxID=2052170 RepID=UPI003BAE36B3
MIETAGSSRKKSSAFHDYLAGFRGPSGLPARVEETSGPHRIRQYTGEFWTSRQRQASSLHEISYRACFKAQLPRFFIDLLTQPGDIVYDPFSGRGTTAIEAGLRGRQVIANDVNPLSRILTEPRLFPPLAEEVAVRLADIPRDGDRADRDLSMFYHPDTEREIVALRQYLLGRRDDGIADAVDRWIGMVATNRLTGHSSGFFSVYTLPPNQAVSQKSQERINRNRGQVPEYRDTHRLIHRKTKSLLAGLTSADLTNLNRAGADARFFTGDARATPGIVPDTVRLTVTSPPFLDIVKYREDNWLRCWFCGLDEDAIGRTITMARTVGDWEAVMGEVFRELFRITAPGGYVAFEVGEVRKKTVRLEEHVVPPGLAARFTCEGILINQQAFSKTSNIWGIGNNECGTNTNRIVVFSKAKGS